jgi:hypothetical protein
LGPTFWLVSSAPWQSDARSFAGQPDARLSAQCVHRTFERELEDNARAPTLSLFAQADRDLGDFFRQSASASLNADASVREHACSVSVALLRVHDWGVEYAVLQDAVVALRTPQARAGRVLEDPRPQAFRDVFLQAQARRLLHGQGFDDPQFLQHLHAMHDQERKTRNTPQGYPAMVGDELATRKVLRGRLRTPLRGLEIVLANPGATRAWNVFQMPLRDLFTQGLSDWAQALRRREWADDRGRWFPRESVHEDLGLLRIRFLGD